MSASSMKLLGRDISGNALLTQLEERLKARGLTNADGGGPIRFDGLEAKVDPMAFNVEALTEHADPTRALPLETHRSGLGRAVLMVKWVFRKGGQVFINEAFARQKRFNGHVRDSYAQLSAEVVRLRARLDAAEAQLSKSQSPPRRKTR
jgi:hypothetical protein